MVSRTYTEDDFIEAWNNSVSMAECARRLNIVPAGGNYSSIKNFAMRLGLSNQHMAGQGWSKGTRRPSKRKPIEDVLVDGSQISSVSLKKRLFNEGIFEKKCCICEIEQWLGKPAPLELDHINGVKTDNRIENLRILCPNCHAQTDTYRGKNIKKIPSLRIKESALCKCGSPIRKSSKQCSPCYRIRQSSGLPTKEEVERVLKSNGKNLLQTGLHFGVSDNAVRKWCKKYDISTTK